jgi:hypothetical protein
MIKLNSTLYKGPHRNNAKKWKGLLRPMFQIWQPHNVAVPCHLNLHFAKLIETPFVSICIHLPSGFRTGFHGRVLSNLHNIWHDQNRQYYYEDHLVMLSLYYPGKWVAMWFLSISWQLLAAMAVCSSSRTNPSSTQRHKKNKKRTS